MSSYEIICGDMKIEVPKLPTLYDSCVTDCPYELSNDGKASAARVFLEVMFPEDAKVKAEGAGECQLSFLIEQILRLSGVGGLPTPTPAVPVRAMTLDGNSSGRDEDVEDCGESAVRAPDCAAGDDAHAETPEHLGRFALKLTDPVAMLDTLNGAGCGFLSGGFGVGFRVCAPDFPYLLSDGPVVNDGDPLVCLLYDALPYGVRFERVTAFERLLEAAEAVYGIRQEVFTDPNAVHRRIMKMRFALNEVRGLK